VLSSQNSDVRLVIGSGNLLSNKLLYPKLVVVNHVPWTLYNNPITLVTDDAFGGIEFVFHVSFMLVLVTRLALAYSAVTGH
jgi:hypothetical protein